VEAPRAASGWGCWSRAAALSLLPLGCTLLVYGRTLGHEFVFDDRGLILENPAAHDPTDIAAIFTSDYWGFTGQHSGLYRPLTVWLHALLYSAFGGRPLPFHAFNLLAHAAVAALLVAMLRRLGADPRAARLGGALFALHPIHVEAVAPATGSAELLAALWFLVALLCHQDRPGGRWAIWRSWPRC
jgi:hypothetical protein